MGIGSNPELATDFLPWGSSLDMGVRHLETDDEKQQVYRRADGWRAARAAGQYAVDGHGRQRGDTQVAGPRGQYGTVHVEHDDVAGRAGAGSDAGYDVLADAAAGAEDLFFARSCHGFHRLRVCTLPVFATTQK